MNSAFRNRRLGRTSLLTLAAAGPFVFFLHFPASAQTPGATGTLPPQEWNSAAALDSENDDGPRTIGPAIDHGSMAILDANGITRREALGHLFTRPTVEIIWGDESFATQVVYGRYSGSVEAIARKLLAGSNYLIAVEEAHGTRQIARIVVLSSTSAPQTSSLSAPSMRASDQAQPAQVSRPLAPSQIKKGRQILSPVH